MLNLFKTQCQSTPMDDEVDALYKIWDTFVDGRVCPIMLDADFIFLPLVFENHHFCICINKIQRSVDVLDHTSYAKGLYSEVSQLSRFAALMMSDFLETKDISDACHIPDYEVRLLPLKWQTKLSRDLESGCFVMIRMLEYEGHTFESNLGSSLSRRVFVAELVATLCLCDINKNRSQFLSNLQMHNSEKSNFWPDLEAKRKISKIVKKKMPNYALSDAPFQPISVQIELPILGDNVPVLSNRTSGR